MLVEVVQAVRGVVYAAAAQGVRRFWKRAKKRPEMEEFANHLQRLGEMTVVDNVQRSAVTSMIGDSV
jgi:hypothetical protein